MSAACSVGDCKRSVYRAGICRRHHYRLKAHGSPTAGGPIRETAHAVTCSAPGCDGVYLAKGLCAMHYARRREHGDPLYQPTLSKNQPCSVRGCKANQVAIGYCGKHYQRHARHGDPVHMLRAENGNGTTSVKGYRIVHRPGHPNADRHGRLPEHRLVMSEKLGRPLRDDENVYHINGVRTDNRPENLELWVKSQPCGQRVNDVLSWAREVIARYGDK